MSPTFFSLLCFGLSFVQAMEANNGSLSKPQLQVHPISVVVPGTDVIFSCILSTNSSSQPGTFILQKEPNAEHVQSNSGGGTMACFPMYSLRQEDTGNYSCIYKETTGSYRVSEPSETLQLLVTETLPKPFISVTPSNLVDSGGNVTLRCWGTVQGVRFALYKEGEKTFVGTREPTQDGVEFHLTHVNINNSGKYSCHYDLGPESKVSKSSSDLLELTVQSEEQRKKGSLEVSRMILIVFSCISTFFFLFCLLAFLGYRHSQTAVTSHGQTPRRSPCLCFFQHSCFSPNPGSPPKDPKYKQKKKRRQREMTGEEDEDSEEINYICLNKEILCEAQPAVPSMAAKEHTLYASLAIHH